MAFTPQQKYEYRQWLRAHGVCTRCYKRPIEPPSSANCGSCRATLLAHAVHRTNRRVANKLCIYCGKPLGRLDKGHVTHNRHRCTLPRRIT